MMELRSRENEIVREFVRSTLLVDIKKWHDSVDQDYLTNIGLNDSEIAIVESFVNMSIYFYFGFVEVDEYFSSAEFKRFFFIYKNKMKPKFESVMLSF
jgi:hypothetical protein